MASRWHWVGLGAAAVILIGCGDNSGVTTPESGSVVQVVEDSQPVKSQSGAPRATDESLVGYVNPFIGTSNFGATHPGATVPHGLASVSPFNTAFNPDGLNAIEKDSRWNSAVYVAENKFLTGFSHINLSGVGCPEVGVVLAMPSVGELAFDPQANGTTYSNEVAEPGYYSVSLDNGVEVEATASLRSGATRYTFPEGKGNLLINLGLGLTNETGATVRMVGENKLEGSRMIGTFCYNPEDVRPLFFAAELVTPADERGLFKKAIEYRAVEADWIGYNDEYKPYDAAVELVSGDDVGAYFSFDEASSSKVELRVGVSFVSTENAWENLKAEQGGKSFDELREEASGNWDAALQRIRVEGSDAQKTKFYTALYHALIHPSILQDVNGDYPKVGGGFGTLDDGNRYTVFSLWDTYRNVHTLLSLVYPERQSDMVRSMIDIYSESGWFPKWELYAMETEVMVGDPALPVITDTWRRGIRDFDIDTAYEAMKKHASLSGGANKIRPFMDDYLSLGYVPLELEDQWGGSVSSAIEYAIADWAVAELAADLGRKEDADRFAKQSVGYRAYFDIETGMLRPKYRDGTFYPEFDPEQGKNFEPVVGFVEGTAWNYRFYAPHDLPWLIEQNGGADSFVAELDRLFETDNFDMANEPDINYPFLYNYVPGYEHKTGPRVSELIDAHYGAGPAGLPGNDDAGTLSTWLIFSMMGIYPVTPGDTDYAIFTPQLDEVEIALHPDYYEGGSIIFSKDGAGTRMTGASWNGSPVGSFFVNHNDLVKGGALTFNHNAKDDEGAQDH